MHEFIGHSMENGFIFEKKNQVWIKIEKREKDPESHLGSIPPL